MLIAVIRSMALFLGPFGVILAIVIPIIAMRHKDDADRENAIQDAMDEYLSDRLVEHGFKGDRDAIWSVLGIDIVLNAQGLVAWLKRLEKHDG